MTVNELLEKSANELEKMSDAELNTYFAPYLKAVRPSEELKAKHLAKTVSGGSKLSSANRSYKPTSTKEQAAKIMKQFEMLLEKGDA